MKQTASKLPFVTLVALVWCVGSSTPALGQCEITPVTASDGLAGQKFGWSTAISGDYAVVGTDEPSTSTGAAYVYERDGLFWNEIGRLVPETIPPEPPVLLANDDEYGRAVAISGRVVVVGARKRDIAGRTNQGAVYVFRRDELTGEWAYQQELTASDRAAGDLFGAAVAIDGDWIVVGAPENDNFGLTNSGTAYAFYFDGLTWTQARKFRADDQGEGDKFANAVAISGNWFVVGNARDDDPCPDGADATNSGSVSTFFHDPAAAPNVGWEQRTKLQARIVDGTTVSCDAGFSDNFGHAVAISGDRLVVGAVNDDDDDGGVNSGSAYVYRLEEPGWVIEQKLTASDGAALNNFGRSVAIHDDLVLVGASKGDLDDPAPIENTGSAYLYRRSGTEWIAESELTASDAGDCDPSSGADCDRFGWYVSIGGDYAAIGAYRKNTSTGAAYFFAVGTASDCDENGVHDDCDILADPSVFDSNNNGILDSCECTIDDDCAGALECITGTCDLGTSLCVFTVNDDFCAVAGTCFADGEFNPENECETCNHALNGKEWSNLDAGSPCGDPSDATCDRPDTCNGGGLCRPNIESAGTACADDGNECTNDQCDGAGACGHPDVSDSTPCTADGNECTDNFCLSGQCSALFTSNGAPCGDPFNSECDPADTCDGAGNCLANIRDDGTPCFDDGLFCTGEDLCQSGVCESSGDPCTADGLICDANAELRNKCSCDREVEGVCDDGLFCSGVEVCQAGVCLSSGDPCDGTGLLCDEATDTCACGDFDDCDDGVFCNGEEACVGDLCVSAGDPCSLPTPFCDEVTDSCVCISDADCDDGDECTGVEFCDAQGTCRHALVFDCNANGLEDACDVDSENGESFDCNDDGVPDECEVEVRHDCCEGAHGAGCNDPQIAACVCTVDAYCCDVDWDRLCAEQVETLECGLCVSDNDCNGNGVPDACDIATPFTSISGMLSPIDDVNPQSYTIVAPPQAAGDVTLTFTASADLQASSEFIDVDINGTPFGTVFQTGAGDCPITPDAATFLVPASVFNAVVESGDAVITMTPSPNVDVFVCTSPYIIVGIEYETGTADCNGNGIPDECDLAEGTSDDCTENGTPDECEADCNDNHIADICELNDGTAIDCNRNGVPDDCDLLDATSLDCQANGIPDECDVPSIQLLTNGGFETGDLTGWAQFNTGSGQIGIDDGTLDPPGPGGQLPPCHGVFSSVISQSGPGRHSLYQQVTIPDGASAAALSWTDRIRNHALDFSDSNQEFRVEIWDTDNLVLREVFSTDPGDPLISDCTERTFDVSAFIGQTVRVAFTEEDDLNYFNVNIDNVRLAIPTDGTSQDCNQNLIPDECDISSGAGGDCNLNTALDECEAIGGGDFDNDSSVDLDDYAFFAECLGGPGVSPTPNDPICKSLCLRAFDLDADGDTDLHDAGAFQTVFGSVVP